MRRPKPGTPTPSVVKTGGSSPCRYIPPLQLHTVLTVTYHRYNYIPPLQYSQQRPSRPPHATTITTDDHDAAARRYIRFFFVFCSRATAPTQPLTSAWPPRTRSTRLDLRAMWLTATRMKSRRTLDSSTSRSRTTSTDRYQTVPSRNSVAVLGNT